MNQQEIAYQCVLLRKGLKDHDFSVKQVLQQWNAKRETIEKQLEFIMSKCSHPNVVKSYKEHYWDALTTWTTCVDCGYETSVTVQNKYIEDDSWDLDET